MKVLREQDFGSYEGKAFTERPRTSDKLGQAEHLNRVRNNPNFKDVETKESMILRMKTFVNSHLVELFEKEDHVDSVAVVAHGIILSYLWRCILELFEPRIIVLAPNVMIADRGMGLKFLGGWANTGYMDLEIQKKFASIQVHGPASSEVQSSTSPPCGGISDDAQDSQIATELADLTTPSGIISVPAQAELDPAVPSPVAGFEALFLTVTAVNCRDHLRDLKKTRGGIGSMKHDEKQAKMDSFFKRQKME